MSGKHSLKCLKKKTNFTNGKVETGIGLDPMHNESVKGFIRSKCRDATPVPGRGYEIRKDSIPLQKAAERKRKREAAEGQEEMSLEKAMEQQLAKRLKAQPKTYQVLPRRRDTRWGARGRPGANEGRWADPFAADLIKSHQI